MMNNLRDEMYEKIKNAYSDIDLDKNTADKMFRKIESQCQSNNIISEMDDDRYGRKIYRYWRVMIPALMLLFVMIVMIAETLREGRMNNSNSKNVGVEVLSGKKGYGEDTEWNIDITGDGIKDNIKVYFSRIEQPNNENKDIIEIYSGKTKKKIWSYYFEMHDDTNVNIHLYENKEGGKKGILIENEQFRNIYETDYQLIQLDDKGNEFDTEIKGSLSITQDEVISGDFVERLFTYENEINEYIEQSFILASNSILWCSTQSVKRVNRYNGNDVELKIDNKMNEMGYHNFWLHESVDKIMLLYDDGDKEPLCTSDDKVIETYKEYMKGNEGYYKLREDYVEEEGDDTKGVHMQLVIYQGKIIDIYCTGRDNMIRINQKWYQTKEIVDLSDIAKIIENNS